MIQADIFDWVPPAPQSILGPRDGETFNAKQDTKRLNKQAVAVWEAMSDGRWYSLEELQDKLHKLHPDKHFPITSISARTRDFRKACYGCTRETLEATRLDNGLWRYRLHPEKRIGA